LKATPRVDRRPASAASAAGYGAVRASGGTESHSANVGRVYDLRLIGGDSDSFYDDVSRFSDRLLTEFERRAAPALDGFRGYAATVLGEPERSRGEYGLELLTLGLSLRRYGRAARRSPRWAMSFTRRLLALRHASERMKPAADRLRAWATRSFLMPGIVQAPLPCPKAAACERGRPCGKSQRRERLCPRFKSSVLASPPPAATAVDPNLGRKLLKSLPKLLAWLRATGEFDQEAVRMGHWKSYLGTLPAADAAHWTEVSVALFDWFQREAGVVFRGYTRGVSRFLATEYRQRGSREDQIFCGREAVEYHLGMVCTEIVNRGLRTQFEATKRKAVLVPGCLRGDFARGCKARVEGVDMICAGCTPECGVNRIAQRMRSFGALVYLVPHASGFSRWLERWQREPEMGVVAVACLLNILPGGYEMRARGIASQCVPLDFPGCQKHWHSAGIATGLNEERLVQLATGRPQVAS
jgi:hypothetical protein